MVYDRLARSRQREVTMDEDAVFLSAGQAAKRLGKSRATIGRWCASGRMLAVKMPRNLGWAIPEAEVELVLAKRDVDRRSTVVLHGN